MLMEPDYNNLSLSERERERERDKERKPAVFFYRTAGWKINGFV